MVTYIALIDYTAKGISAIKDAPRRSAEFGELAASLGVTVRDIYWTGGAHDGVLIFDAPDGETASALLLSLAGKGNVKTQTLRAWSREEMEDILSKMP